MRPSTAQSRPFSSGAFSGATVAQPSSEPMPDDQPTEIVGDMLEPEDPTLMDVSPASSSAPDPYFPDSEVYATGSFWSGTPHTSIHEMYDVDHPLFYNSLPGRQICWEPSSVASTVRTWTEAQWHEGVASMEHIGDSFHQYHVKGPETWWDDECYELVLFKSEAMSPTVDGTTNPMDSAGPVPDLHDIFAGTSTEHGGTMDLPFSNTQPEESAADIGSSSCTPHWSPWSMAPLSAMGMTLSPAWQSMGENLPDFYMERRSRSRSTSGLAPIDELRNASSEVDSHLPPQLSHPAQEEVTVDETGGPDDGGAHGSSEWEEFLESYWDNTS